MERERKERRENRGHNEGTTAEKGRQEYRRGGKNSRKKGEKDREMEDRRGRSRSMREQVMLREEAKEKKE